MGASRRDRGEIQDGDRDGGDTRLAPGGGADRRGPRVYSRRNARRGYCDNGEIAARPRDVSGLDLVTGCVARDGGECLRRSDEERDCVGRDGDRSDSRVRFRGAARGENCEANGGDRESERDA